MIVTNRQARLTHRVKIHQSSAVVIEQMLSWCHERFGTRFSIVDRPVDRPKFGRDGTWQCVHDGSNRHQVTYIFAFDHGQDALMFQLRWS
jgi:hypothetical protein